MYLVSDLLYNSQNLKISNFWKFKQDIEEYLPEIFEDLNKEYQYIIL
jgi:hypothetical protein